MMTKVEKRLIISGVQYCDGERLESNLDSSAAYYRKADKDYIFYKEYQEDGSVLSCRLTIMDRQLELKKSGNGISILRFCLDGEQECIYQSPLGQLSLRSDTKKLCIKKNDDSLEVLLEYSLYMSGNFMSDYELKIEVK